MLKVHIRKVENHYPIVKDKGAGRLVVCYKILSDEDKVVKSKTT